MERLEVSRSSYPGKMSSMPWRMIPPVLRLASSCVVTLNRYSAEGSLSPLMGRLRAEGAVQNSWNISSMELKSSHFEIQEQHWTLIPLILHQNYRLSPRPSNIRSPLLREWSDRWMKSWGVPLFHCYGMISLWLSYQWTDNVSINGHYATIDYGTKTRISMRLRSLCSNGSQSSPTWQ